MKSFDNDIIVNRTDATTKYDGMFKIIFIGDEHVGKTSILTRFIVNIFDNKINSKTVGIDLYNVYMQLLSKKDHIGRSPITSPITYKFQIWDCAGNYSYQQIVSNYARDAHVYVYVYDISDRSSFYNIREWQQLVFRAINQNSNSNNHNPKDHKIKTFNNNIIQILIGNKSDCYDGEVTKEEGRKLAESLGMSAFYETSAKSTKNITKVFDHITQLCYIEVPEYYIDINKKTTNKKTTNKKTKSCVLL